MNKLLTIALIAQCSIVGLVLCFDSVGYDSANMGAPMDSASNMGTAMDGGSYKGTPMDGGSYMSTQMGGGSYMVGYPMAMDYGGSYGGFGFGGGAGGIGFGGAGDQGGMGGMFGAIIHREFGFCIH